ncbi:MAG TPA: DUF4242 domain-containing protein [Gemmatimonadales bacterium]|jgi:hypothetical protein|nr:DUF4242 domain-containing protein [Gemmatimonadales bacterium]
MPRYIIERTVGQLSPDELEAAARRSLAAIAELEGVKWIRSFVSHEEGKIYCEYEAPNEELIWEHGRRAQIPVDRVAVVAQEISPAMFR